MSNSKSLSVLLYLLAGFGLMFLLGGAPDAAEPKTGPLTATGQGNCGENLAQAASDVKVNTLFTKDLKDFPGKEGTLITVEYPPGGGDPVHRHNAHGFIYVLEGSIIMQVKGQEQLTLTPGMTFYEGPDDIHLVGRNASTTKPARFLVFLLKAKGAPILVPEK